MKRLNQSGSHIVGLALLVLALGVIGFAGYKVEQAHNKTATATTQSTASTTAPATIANTADLQQTSAALDDASTQLNAGLDDSSMNADLNSML
ncbi:MAG TPA: hypothetical protein VLF69_03705 [Candidatus Saccharimonadales bacterium]|nr:hypothetical protein [Candidatus Saccharimonadales bacterium]